MEVLLTQATLATRCVTALLALTVPLTASTAANAAPTAQPKYPTLQSAWDSEQVAAEAEILFAEVLTENEGSWRVNEDAARRHGVDITEAEAIAKALNTPIIALRHSVKSEEYMKCVLNATGLGGLVGAAGGGGSQLKYLLAVKKWREAAWVIVRLVGVNAIKGGVAGLATTLAGAGAWCATPWAD
ncbi:hypothetical protein MTQ17_09910 [Corynebacterium bovis]|uniref:hypothetical protein n=1 Tax=Corynebacterium bovis TaxID=36808 RepID=UPI003138DF7F